MNGTIRNAAVALGWTTLAMTGLIEPMVGRGKHLALYHWDSSSALLFGPVLVLFALVWACVTVLIASARHPGRWRATVWGTLILLLPWLLANAVAQVFRPIPWLRAVTFAAAILVLFWLILSWRSSMQLRLDRVIDRSSALLLMLAVSGALCLVQICWFWWSARDLNSTHRTVQAAMTAHPGSPHGRVIWIVFDELSYQQVFEHRFPGLQLPAFDALARQSTVWTHVRPAGTKTDVVLPSLIMGRPVTDIRASGAGELLFRPTGNSPWQTFSQQDTVFRDALNDGYSTAIAGWYNPYCRLMPAVVDQCFWRIHTELDNGLASDETFGSNLELEVAAMASGGLHDPGAAESDRLRSRHNVGAKGHVADYQELLTHAESLLADPSAGFVLLHLPVPHPGGIFDRKTGKFAVTHSSYIDNLALADRCLAHLRAALEASGEWDSSTVLVMGDHSWRTSFMWRPERASWTPEDEVASAGGQWDDRPAYLAKLPHQEHEFRIDTPFPAVDTRRLLDRLLAHQLQTPGQLAAWVQHSRQ